MDWAFFVVPEVFVLGAALFVLLRLQGHQAARSADAGRGAARSRVAQVPRFARPGGSPHQPRSTVDDLRSPVRGVPRRSVRLPSLSPAIAREPLP